MASGNEPITAAHLVIARLSDDVFIHSRDEKESLMTIAITGATGQLGRIVVEKLKENVPAASIIALVRSPEKAADLGVTVRAADYAAPETLLLGLSGVDTLLLISSSELGQRTTQHRNVINAAKETGVKHIVYTSLLHADTSLLSLAGEHLETEAALKNSGVTYTILRNGWYTENYTGSLAGAVASGAIKGSAGNGKVSSATREDYADAAVAVLTSAGHDNKVYELAGDTAWTLPELAAEVSKQTGKTFSITTSRKQITQRLSRPMVFRKDLLRFLPPWMLVHRKVPCSTIAANYPN
jgi:NAD(P)H dehydrogenase (quinone)